MREQSTEWQWLHAIERVTIDDAYTGRTGDVETMLVVLSGTFDMVAGGGSWPARGVRSSPLAGLPVALFLPPNTSFGLDHGSGEILMVSSRQPAQEEKKGEASSKKPLLAMAGSGKAFDPATGDWKAQESFPSSPQALLPRHIENHDSDGVELRHVFPFGFKALSLSLDELVIGRGKTALVPPSEFADYPVERAAYYDAPKGLTLDGTQLFGRGVVTELTPASQFTAHHGDVFLALAYAGPKGV